MLIWRKMNKFITETVDGQASGDWLGIQAAASKHHRAKITVEEYSEAKEVTLQQIRWWKGVLLPALAADSGDTINLWETRLKLAVMPDEFQPEVVIIEGLALNCVPSVKTLSCQKTNDLIEGSVAKCHDWGFDWVTLPDSELRKVQ